ncbi:hypothetical protein [Bradyrhizobium nitroreducens]|uniref:hypothetical protein n=1 Tax=Bradyrhizobium nitroreducens TaxID=709803 RepID=UPI000C1F7EDB|nr:hypothetical protein [Bradyrhizobium nitroreducens]
MLLRVLAIFAAFCAFADGVSAGPTLDGKTPACQQFSETRLCGDPVSELPAQVLSEVRDIAGLCKEVGGRPLTGPVIGHGRLAGGPAFWTVDGATLECEGAWSLFSNAHGWDSVIFVSLPDGQVKRFTVVGFGLTTAPAASPTRLWAAVAGVNCGQRDARSTAETIGCERELVWRADAQQLDFAPLSQARFKPAFEEAWAQSASKPDGFPDPRPAAQSPAAPVTRVYTKIDDVRANRHDLCKVVQRSGTRDNPVLEERCPPGPDGWTVSLFSADAREFVRFGRQAGAGKTVSEALEGAFADPNSVIEWRLRDGKPFAAIHRYFLDDRQLLTVHSLQPDKTSCVAAVVNVRRGQDANEQAVSIADRLGLNYRCSRDSFVVD